MKMEIFLKKRVFEHGRGAAILKSVYVNKTPPSPPPLKYFPSRWCCWEIYREVHVNIFGGHLE